MAVIAGLEALKKEGMKVTVYSDSQYVCKSLGTRLAQELDRYQLQKGVKRTRPLAAF